MKFCAWECRKRERYGERENKKDRERKGTGKHSLHYSEYFLAESISMQMLAMLWVTTCPMKWSKNCALKCSCVCDENSFKTSQSKAV